MVPPGKRKPSKPRPPTPRPAPAPPPPPPPLWRTLLPYVLTAVLGSLVSLLVVWLVVPRPQAPDTPTPQPPAVSTKALTLGKEFAPALVESYAAGWEAAASRIDAGGTVAESQAELQQVWQSKRQQAFLERIAPAFAAVLPEGEEPKDQQMRTRVATAWRSFARGLRQGGKP